MVEEQQHPDPAQDLLQGMKAICAYVGKSENTVRKLIREEGLPVVKIGGEWCSDKTQITKWICSYLYKKL